MWLLVTGCFFLFDPGQIQFRARVRLSSCFFYLLTQMKFLATPLIAKFSLEASLSEEALFWRNQTSTDRSAAFHYYNFVQR